MDFDPPLNDNANDNDEWLNGMVIDDNHVESTQQIPSVVS